MAELSWLGNLWDSLTKREEKPTGNGILNYQPEINQVNYVPPQSIEEARRKGLLHEADQIPYYTQEDLSAAFEEYKRSVPAFYASLPGGAVDVATALPKAALDVGFRVAGKPELAKQIEYFPLYSASQEAARSALDEFYGGPAPELSPQARNLATVMEFGGDPFLIGSSTAKLGGATIRQLNRAAEAVERSPLGQGILGLQEQRGLPSMAVSKSERDAARARLDEINAEVRRRGASIYGERDAGMAYPSQVLNEQELAEYNNLVNTVAEFRTGVPSLLGGGPSKMVGEDITPKPAGLLGGVQETGFYSPLERAVGDLTQQKGTGDQMLAMIQKQAGVKPEEVQWTGLGDFLAGKPSVTKSEIEDYLLNNRVELKEVKLQAPAINLESPYATPEVRRILEQHQGEAPNAIQMALTNDYDAYRSLERVNPNLVNLDNWEDVVLNDVLNVQMPYQTADEWQRAINTAEGAGDWNTAEQLTRAWEANEGFGPAGMPKFSQYTTPGGSNYRELLMTMPYKYDAWIAKKAEADAAGREAMNLFQARGTNDPLTQAAMDKEKALWDEANSMRPPAQYESSHYDQPNILAHTRVKDYEQDGQKILHVDEVQSDWHQAGRKQGYRNNGLTDSEKERLAQIVNTPDFASNSEMLNDFHRLNEKAKLAESGVPDAPFKKNWHELSVRRILQEAAEKGYDRVTFTTGRTQGERYDLSKQVKTISVPFITENSRTVRIKGHGGGSFNIRVSNDGIISGNLPSSEQFRGKKLDEVVGKEMADKIMGIDKPKDFSGLDLQVGGEGMKGFYDNMMVKAFNKEGKKYNVKVEPYNLKTGKDGEQVWSMEIPPEMRAKKKAEGSPMFSAAPAIPGAGLLADQQDNKQNQPKYNGVLGF